MMLIASGGASGGRHSFAAADWHVCERARLRRRRDVFRLLALIFGCGDDEFAAAVIPQHGQADRGRWVVCAEADHFRLRFRHAGRDAERGRREAVTLRRREWCCRYGLGGRCERGRLR